MLPKIILLSKVASIGTTLLINEFHKQALIVFDRFVTISNCSNIWN